MSKKWTLAEGIQKLLPTEGDPEINDLGISKRQLTLDVSFSLGATEEGEECLSVILSTLGLGEGEYMHLSGTITPDEGETLQELAVRVTAMFNIRPDERVWENGEDL